MNPNLTKSQRADLISLKRKLGGALTAVYRRYRRVRGIRLKATEEVQKHWAKHSGGCDGSGLPILNVAPTKNDVARNRELRKEAIRLRRLEDRSRKLWDELTISHGYIHNAVFWKRVPAKSFVARAERRLVEWAQLRKNVEKEMPAK